MRGRFEESYIAPGHHAALAFLGARPGDVASLLLAREADELLERRAVDLKVPVRRCDARELDRVAGGVAHQGIVAVGRPPPPAPARLDPVRHRIALALDGVTDPRNVGALVRSAEGSGAGAVILARDHAPGLTPALVKSAAGAVEWVPIVRLVNLARGLKALRDAGFWLIGLDGSAPLDIYQPGAVPGLPCVIVVGAEGAGLRPLTRSVCHRLVRIPMAGRGESLNVAVAAAVALFEIRRAVQVAERG